MENLYNLCVFHKLYRFEMKEAYFIKLEVIRKV